MFYHLIISFRNLRRNIGYSLISILGLAIGFMATLFIFVYVWQESHYDNFHQRELCLHRVSATMTQNGVSGRSSELVAPIGPAMKAEIPEVEAYTRLSWAGAFTMVYEQSLLKRENIYFADTSFLQLFNFPLKRGDIKTALAAPYSIVLTEETAAALFGHEDPIGKTITVNEEMQYVTRRIQGASVSDIWRLLTQRMVIIISIGNLLIWPVTWFILEQLLGYFAYRITMGWSVFVLTWLCSLLLALAAFSFQLSRATQPNPAEVIKVE
ncbi:MAG: ABC transporter permease [Prevotellaceae bacterium]|jgi:hypothetical protein|nr:ABC transporter permease [Prevotellaceae bacterium]